MNRADLLMPSPMLPSVIDALDSVFTLHRLWEQPDPDAFLRDHGAAVRGIAASTFGRRIDATLMDRLPNLEIIASFGVGYDNVDAEAAAARGIVVTNTPGVLDDEVADFTIGLLLATIRRLPQADRFVREGKWLEGAFPLGATLRGRRVGIVGLGNIGKAIARRLEGFGVGILYHGRTRQPGVAYPYYETPEALAAACDTLIVIVPGGAETRHMIGASVLAALGKDGILINVARGSVVDEAALVEALAARTILAAGLDVYEDEPNVPAALIARDDVVLLPHIGSASHHTRAALGQLVVDNLLAWFAGKPALTPVNETRHLQRG